MTPFDQIPDSTLQDARVVLTDLDDTLTDGPRLPSQSLRALEQLRASGLVVVVVTGRSAGWCDHFSRQWPCDAVIGETGAFAFCKNSETGFRSEIFADSESVRQANREKLDALGARILASVPGSALASDQRYRLCDLAIDLGEDVPRLAPRTIELVLKQCRDAGATAVASACHVNAWFGTYDKLWMSRRVLREHFGIDPDEDGARILSIGDSANDLPMFQGFENSVGVANVHDLSVAGRPVWVTRGRSATGFVEFADRILRARDARAT